MSAAAGDGELLGALGRLAAEAGRAVRAAADTASKELSGALGRDQFRWPANLSLAGPTLPAPYKAAGQALSWQDGYMATCVVSSARCVQQHGAQPFTAALVASLAAVHLKPGGYRLLQASAWPRGGAAALT